jgi:hypothetical protein
MYGDLEKGQFYYFDSYGTEPKYEIKKFIKRLVTWYVKKNEISVSVDETETFMNQNDKNNVENCNKLDIRYNTNRHQYKNSECGVYSMNFILRLLSGETFEDINNEKNPDDTVNECRKTYFIHK